MTNKDQENQWREEFEAYDMTTIILEMDDYSIREMYYLAGRCKGQEDLDNANDKIAKLEAEMPKISSVGRYLTSGQKLERKIKSEFAFIDKFDPEIIMAKVRKAETGCWLIGETLAYTYTLINRKPVLNHRAMYTVHKGNIPHGLVIDHICKVLNCCNPDHLRAVTVKVNSTENSNGPSAINARKTHCKWGHAYDKDNTAYNGKGRVCRACRLQHGRAFRAKTAILHKEMEVANESNQG